MGDDTANGRLEDIQGSASKILTESQGADRNPACRMPMESPSMLGGYGNIPRMTEDKSAKDRSETFLSTADGKPATGEPETGTCVTVTSITGEQILEEFLQCDPMKRVTVQDMKVLLEAKTGVQRCDMKLLLGKSTLGDETVLDHVAASDEVAGVLSLTMVVSRRRLRSVLTSSTMVLRLWDNEDCGSKMRMLRGHKADVLCLVVDWDSKRALSGGEDHMLCEWDLESCEPLQRLRGSSPIRCVAADWASRQAISADGSSVRLWDLRRGESCWQLEARRVTCIDASFARGQALSACETVLKLWGLEQGVCEKRIPITHRVHCLEVSWNLRRAAIGVAWAFEILDLDSEEVVFRFCSKARLLCISVNWQDHEVIAGDDDGALRLWDFETGEMIQELRGHTAKVESVNVDWCSGHLLSGSADCSWRFWDFRRNVLFKEMQGHATANCISGEWIS
eukprot:TRINITY_DN43844_c0_g1_i1.p1 TRINITY_DN43844_c0_g1~~TRINITY_DN43844_c0_g1_i1.p1  ORF type:complete len:452 (+),score=82.04 TRINITY_DN43844_c0_g1_i1:76-1431(+)